MADFNELIRKDGTRKSISVRIIPEDTNTYIYIPSENIKILAGFKSLWIILFLCIYSRDNKTKVGSADLLCSIII